MKAFYNLFHRKETSKQAQLAASKFDPDEIHVLRMTWQDLADRSGEAGIDKDTFLQYFPLGGLLGERLFAQFDVAGNHIIDFNEFISGLAVMCRGSDDEKIHFIFNMYDSAHENAVSKVELTTLLNHIPREFFAKYERQEALKALEKERLAALNEHAGDRLSRSGSRESFDGGANSAAPQPTVNTSNVPSNAPSTAPSDTESDAGGAASEVGQAINKEDDDEFASLDHYTHHEMVERAFAECDLNHEERLSYESFKMWIQRTSFVLDYIESIFPYSGPKDIHKHKHRQETLPHMKRIVSQSARHSTSIQDVAGEVFKDSVSPRGSSNGGFSRHSSMHRTLSVRSANNMSMDSLPVAPSPLNCTGRPPSSQFASPMSANLGHHRDFSTGSGVAGIAGADGGVTPPTPGMPLMRSPSVGENSVTGENSEETARNLIIQAMEITQDDALRISLGGVLEQHFSADGLGFQSMYSHPTEADVYREVVAMESYLWKKGKSLLHSLVKRFYVLSGNCAYYYHHKNDVRPQGVIFLTGSVVGAIEDTPMALKGYYGFEVNYQDLTSGKQHVHEKRVMYAKSEQERDAWVTALQHAAHVVPVEDDYVIGKELGRGRFSVVRECCNKETGEHFAVKVIDKSTIEPEEKSLLRTEIAVLKLVNHPNIIHMEGLYETKSHIYIVMEMLKGGELFERIVGRPRFSELEAAKLLRPLLESVAYLHDLGIVHRDLKPENILCGEQLDDLKIADFGLSKMVLPQEKMDSACGTLSYVAPEVLTLQGYGKEADLWSVGVILFLLLCGKLPFDGDTTDEIIKSTIQADLKVNPQVWSKLSEDARSLIKALLHKSPRERITARAAIKHPFISNLVGRHSRSLSNLPPMQPQVLVAAPAPDSSAAEAASGASSLTQSPLSLSPVNTTAH